MTMSHAYNTHTYAVSQEEREIIVSVILTLQHTHICRVSQEERSTFREIIVSVIQTLQHTHICRVSQEEREIIVSVILTLQHTHICSVPRGKANIQGDHSVRHSKKKKFIWTCVLFRTVSEIELFECTVTKLLIRKKYDVLFLIFIVQVTNLLVYNTFSKISPSTSIHFATRARTWRVARLSSSWFSLCGQ
jgi:hypothetical protein